MASASQKCVIEAFGLKDKNRIIRKANKMLYFNSKYPTYAKDIYNGFILIKFVPTIDRLNNFLDGRMYMNGPNSFHDEMMGEARNDNMEGATICVNGSTSTSFPKVEFHQKDGDIYTIIRELKEKPENYIEPHFILWPNEPKRKNIFCMYTLWLNSFQRKFCEINVDMIKKFGNYGVLINNQNEFFNRVGTALLKYPEIHKAECGFIEYIPEDNSKGIIDLNPFIKFSKGYRDQNEFRFCFDKGREGVLDFKLDSTIRDIATPIQVDKFLKSLKYENDNTIVFESMT